MSGFGETIRNRREELQKQNPQFSLRAVAGRVPLEPSYLSRIERGLEAPPSEQTIRRLAEILEFDSDALLALAGKVSADLADIIRKRPVLFGQLIRELKHLPDQAVLRLVREIRDGNW
ncbi:MAG: XRE family transcriptional regulator [Planctomycetes bacterium]|nr:XRE family transcriptional regulator [Planctomycetota bacterium]